MADAFHNLAGSAAIEQLLAAELQQSDQMLATSTPILRHLLSNTDNSMFNDEIVARVRGQFNHLAQQLVIAIAGAAGHADPQAWAHEASSGLAEALMVDDALLSHCHALAIEWQLIQRLQGRSAIDPVSSPLLQAMIAGDEEPVAPLAMRFVAAQVRFGQQAQRMELPVDSLSAELLHRLLQLAEQHVLTGDTRNDIHVGEAFTAIRAAHDESASRLGLAARLIAGIGGGARAALSVEHAGASLFLTAVASFSNCDRAAVAMATSECQLPRLALILVASGLRPAEVDQQFSAIHPDITLPEGIDLLGADRAAAMLVG